METRTTKLLSTREHQLGQIHENSSWEEKFQNITLRPILKFQNEIILEIFSNYIKEHKGNFHQFRLEKRIQFIEEALQKDQKLKNLYKGIVVGHFTIEEMKEYHQNKSSINRRIYSLIIERLKNQIILFDIQVQIS
jgi:predicted DNA binding CopG/RHH family protein